MRLFLALVLLVAVARATPTEEEVRAGIRKGLAFLLEDQNQDGSWGSYREPRGRENRMWTNIGTHNAWTAATTGLVCVTLMDLGKTASPQARAALHRGLDYLLKHGLVKRVSNWDVDNVWGYVYSLEAVGRALRHEGIKGTPREKPLRELGRKLIERMVSHQTPGGGWAYYDDPPYMRRPSWATSFTTAAAILALLEARESGLKVDQKVMQRAVSAVKHCRLPSGAYTYSVNPVPAPGRLTGINQVKGSLSRIQVGNLALHRTGGGVTRDDLREGLDLFFKHHRFLAIGRGRPIPHEAYYAVAGYFFYFGHYYAAGAIEALPAGERTSYWRRIQEKILVTQEKDGSMWDFHSHKYHRPYGTAWGVSILQRSLQDRP